MPKRSLLLLAACLLGPPAQSAEPVSPLRVSVSRAVEALKSDTATLPRRFDVPTDETRSAFAERLIGLQQEAGLAELELRKLLEDLEQLPGHLYRDETVRWQATHDYVRARLERRIVYLANYNLMLVWLRREVRSSEIKGGWRLVGEKGEAPEARELDRSSAKRLRQLAERHPSSPWEALARRELLTPVKLEWRPID